MQDYEQLVPDAEMFRKVWKRVMPDEAQSPIAVRPPEEDARRRPAPPAPPPGGPPQAMDDRGILMRLLNELDEGATIAGALSRRVPGAGSLAESLRRDMAQTRAVYYFLTGRRWRPERGMLPPRENTDGLLRRLYLWEVGFYRLCAESEREARDEDLRELLPELREESRNRRRLIRRLAVRR